MKLNLPRLALVLFVMVGGMFGQSAERDPAHCLSTDDAAKVLGQEAVHTLTEGTVKAVLCTYDTIPTTTDQPPDELLYHLTSFETVEAAREAFAKYAASDIVNRKGKKVIEDIGDEALYVPFGSNVIFLTVRLDKRIVSFHLGKKGAIALRDTFLANIKNILP